MFECLLCGAPAHDTHCTVEPFDKAVQSARTARYLCNILMCTYIYIYIWYVCEKCGVIASLLGHWKIPCLHCHFSSCANKLQLISGHTSRRNKLIYNIPKPGCTANGTRQLQVFHSIRDNMNKWARVRRGSAHFSRGDQLK